MFSPRVLGKLERLHTHITICAQIDPSIAQVLETVDDNTVITWSVYTAGTIKAFTVVKHPKGFQKLITDEKEPSSDLWFHCDAPYTLAQVFLARVPLTQLIANEAVIVCGSSRTTMAMIRLITMTLPYRYGLSKARAIHAPIKPPISFTRKRFQFLLRMLIRKKGGH
jgi:hypothetical protein